LRLWAALLLMAMLTSQWQINDQKRQKIHFANLTVRIFFCKSITYRWDNLEEIDC